ncbi:MAG: acyl--CoA ligase family protein [Desulfomonilaceae bacterium]|nr:acyl--CoA ligase family protein [Desulfomonilaceae bacterium]
MNERSANYELLTPVSFLERTARVYPDKDAIVNGDRRHTYGEFHNRVHRLAQGLKNAGIHKGDKVAVICANTPHMLEAHFAVPLIGAVLVPVNFRLTASEVAYILNHSRSKAVFVDNEFADLVKPKIHEIPDLRFSVNICDIDDSTPLDGMEYEAFLAGASDEPVVCDVDDERGVISINYTSGTTGKPKGVMCHHRGAYLNALGEALEFSINYESVYLWTLPMFHCNGWCFPWTVTAVGATHVCLRRATPEEIFRLIQKENVTHMCGAPTVLITMTSFPGARDVKLKRKLSVITAAAPPAPTVIENIEDLGAEVEHVYGLTEVYGPHSICANQIAWKDLPAEERARLKARQGVPYVTAQFMEVVDPESMNPVPWDGETLGEIVMRGNNVMLGYYRQDEATEEAFKGGWFHSGDLAVVHPDGYVEIRDRAKDIIISGGENISSVEVERVIYRHPDVLEAAIIGVPHEKWGEVPKAFIVVKPGTNPSEQDIIAFCRERLARFKVPKSVEFGDLPKTATGKVMKNELRNREWAGRDKKVN